MIRLFACGDWVNSTGRHDYIDESLLKIIRSSDVSICNFEGPVANENATPHPKAGPHVAQHPHAVQIAASSGFNILSLANNHIYDYGKNGLAETLRQAEKNNIRTVGAGLDFSDAYKAVFFEKENISIAIISCGESDIGCLSDSHGHSGYAWLFHHQIEDEIRIAAKSAHHVVVIVHAGVEDVPIPLKEFRDRYRRLCDIGAAVVIGHHPHVPQGLEHYNEKLIFYSLGNFYFDTDAFRENTCISYAVSLTFTEKEVAYLIHPVHQSLGQATAYTEKDWNPRWNNLCLALENSYEKDHDRMCIDLFNKYYYQYYQHAVEPGNKIFRFIQRMKRALRPGLKKKDETRAKRCLLLHNIRIESHRFVVQRALSLLIKNE